MSHQLTSYLENIYSTKKLYLNKSNLIKKIMNALMKEGCTQEGQCES